MKCETCGKELSVSARGWGKECVHIDISVSDGSDWRNGLTFRAQCDDCPVPGVEFASYSLDDFTVKHLDNKRWSESVSWAMLRHQLVAAGASTEGGQGA